MRQVNELLIFKTSQNLQRTNIPGNVKTIGVSNFSEKTLTDLLDNSNIVPAINQVELHPCLPQEELKVFCDSKGIVLTAYSPLGKSHYSFRQIFL